MQNSNKVGTHIPLYFVRIMPNGIIPIGDSFQLLCSVGTQDVTGSLREKQESTVQGSNHVVVR